jgi:hypothetical protein
MPDPSEIPTEIPQQLLPCEGKRRTKIIAISLVAAFMIILGAVVYQNSLFTMHAGPTASAIATVPVTASPVPVGMDYIRNLNFKQQFELAIQKRNERNCAEAVPLFTGALAAGTTLSVKDRARAWFWKGLCEYEAGSKPAALTSFQNAETLDPTNTSISAWIKMSALTPSPAS